MELKVCILYGFTEGPWHGKKMRQAILKRGWEVVNEPTEASCIIAHSGGVFNLPKPTPHQHILLIDPTCPADKDGKRHVLKFILWEIRHTTLSRQGHVWFWRMCHNAWYFLTDFSHSRDIAHKLRTKDISGIFKHDRTIITQSDNRTWFDHQTLLSLAGPAKPKLYFLSTDHDDCWVNPDRYLNLINLSSTK